jgi:hypothetical protein
MFPRNASKLAIFVCLTLGIAAAATTISDLQSASGWNGCNTCTNSTGTASSYSMTQNIASPSLDGKSAHFHLGASAPLADALWYKRVLSNSGPTHFAFDVQFYYKDSSVPTGMEFSANEHVNTRWYRWDWQCSYYFGVWRIWDNANGKWVNTSAPCIRPTNYTWTHVTLETHRYNGKVYFDAVTVNGQKHYINISVYPKTLSYSGNWVTVHYQLNGGRSGAAVDTWADKFSLTYW